MDEGTGKEGNNARVKQLQLKIRPNRAELIGARRNLQQYTRKIKSPRWEAEEFRQATNKNVMKAF